jgi:hypothetical protein
VFIEVASDKGQKRAHSPVGQAPAELVQCGGERISGSREGFVL